MNRNAFLQVKEVLPQRRQYTDSELTPKELLAKSRVTPTTLLPPMEHLFLMYDIPCFYRGELVAVCGKAKSGKTLFLSIIMACCLKSRILALERSRQPPCTSPPEECSEQPPLRVLWLDTEQSQQSTQDIIVSRIMPLAGITLPCPADSTPAEQAGSTFDDTFFAYNLRGMGFEKRRELMEEAISTVKPDLVIIDGIKDLVTDINDAVQATLVIEQLMSLAQGHHCCIVNVLHQNKSEADQNMRGSIGTELTNKAFEVYTCEYIEERDTFKVKQRLSRRERIKRKLYYQLDKGGLPSTCGEVTEQPRDAQGRWVKTTEADIAPTVWETFNQKYIIRHEDQPGQPYEWDLSQLFEDAFEGRSSRTFSQVMGAALRLSHIQDKSYYYARFNEAEQRGIIRSEKHPETGETWVEYRQNQLPF